MKNQLPDYVHLTSDVSQTVAHVFKVFRPDKVGILVDENTKQYCLAQLDVEPTLIIEIESGEINKNLDTCERIWLQMTEAGFSRKSLLINLGGGVIGDMGGFCAATYKRGIAFINVPTTLLAQVDASVGGKLGVDFHKLKNHIGVFKEPEAVIVDPGFLQTLPKRELYSGFAEVIKHALIYDVDHWNYLKQTSPENLDWEKIILRSIEIKHKVVSEDPMESGLRKILNFGHTLGHALESYWLPTEHRLLHGEAVALGMILESHLSMQKEFIPREDYVEIRTYIESLYQLPKDLPELIDLKILLSQDKKNNNGNVNFSLLQRIGSGNYDIIANEDEISEALLHQ
ncbi:MAG: 3-dehydroquinate synthase [Bacteroidota bacterium]